MNNTNFPQDLIKNEFKVAFLRKLSDKDVFEICSFAYDEEHKLNMNINFMDPLKGYDLKEITIAKDHEIILLLREKQFGKLGNDKPHCLLASLNSNNLRKGAKLTFQESGQMKDDLQVRDFFSL